jgi:hypothetical protein
MIFLILFRLLNLNGKRPVAVFGDRQGKRLHVKQATMLHCRFPQPGRVCARARGEAAMAARASVESAYWDRTMICL